MLAMLLMGGTATAQHVTVGGDVYGGGNKASVNRGTTVLIDQSNAVIKGDVYGGGAKAKVDTFLIANPGEATTIDSTLVTILQGNVQGNVYGGGLGNADTAAHVYGGVHVSIGNSEGGSATFGKTVSSNVTGGNIFGGNNVNGSPQKNVKVDIWQTAHTNDNEVDHDGVCTTFVAFQNHISHEQTDFAIQAVYGRNMLQIIII